MRKSEKNKGIQINDEIATKRSQDSAALEAMKLEMKEKGMTNVAF